MASASAARGITALALDGVILLAGLLLTVSVGVSLDAGSFVDWLVLAWVLVVAPLYFALDHGRSTGSAVGIGFMAHVGGFLAGLLGVAVTYRTRTQGPARRDPLVPRPH